MASWDGWPEGFIPQAAYNRGDGKVLIFSETEYIRWDIATRQVDSGYPLPIEGIWKGWPISQ